MCPSPLIQYQRVCVLGEIANCDMPVIGVRKQWMYVDGNTISSSDAYRYYMSYD